MSKLRHEAGPSTSGTAISADYIRRDVGIVGQTNTYQAVVEWMRGNLDLIPLIRKDAREANQLAQSEDLRRRGRVKAKKSVSQLLVELAEDRGMSWTDIARLNGVSVSAVRKWRTGGDSSADKRMSLARLAAFLDLLTEVGIQDPAQWMEMPLALPEGYHIRPMDLYAKGHIHALLEMADHHSPEDVLDEIDRSWRDRRSAFQVVEGPDGGKAIKARRT